MKDGFCSRILPVMLVAILAGAFATNVIAQERFGRITGLATDASSAVLPGVKVTITNKGTQRTVSTNTVHDGTYVSPDLDPGRYSVAFEHAGFARAEVPDVVVLVGRTMRANITMNVGNIEQVVEVTEAPPVIDTTSTMIAHNITAEEFNKLPKGRSFQDVALFSTSVNTGEIEGGYQVNGASSAENNYYIDGVSTNSLIDGSSRQNAVFEFLQEVQVKTTGLEAEYGGALGGVVSAVTKSGGNDFHGEGHYYFFGNRLGAGPAKRLELEPLQEQSVSYFDDKKQKRDNHEFGASLGGPFIANKLFFFTSFSPRWQRASYDYVFSNGTEPGTLDRKTHQMNWFNKISFDPAQRIRTNFQWLYTPSYLTGSLYAYDGWGPNFSTRSLEQAKLGQTRGYNQPEQTYSGNIDFTLTNTSLLSIRGGRYYLNFKEIGVPNSYYTWWRQSSVGIPGVPQELQLPSGYATNSGAQVVYDITTRSYIQADYSQFLRFGGQHNLKAGVGVQKNVNKVNDSWYGPDGRTELYWGLSVNGQTGQYGYYMVQDGATNGSTGGTLTHMYIHDSWRIHPRLTLSLGLRAERETIPSFARSVQDYAFRFGFGDKMAPRLGAALDVFGDGRLKISGSWGRFFDWTKYDVARGTFGAEVWVSYYRSLDTLDVFNLNLRNMPGRNLWTAESRNRRVPGFEYLDTGLKPMSAQNMNLGAEYEIMPQMVFSARYVRNDLIRTIEDLGALNEAGDEVYRYGNPGEGNNVIFPSSGGTCTVKSGEACGFPMPKAVRTYDAMELSLNRRFTRGWLASFSYVYSRLYGNYTGLQSSDEIRPPTLASFAGNQQFSAQSYRPGGNANRYWDLDEALWDSHGNAGLLGRLPTDRPHVFKVYAAKTWDFGTEIGTFFRATSGTPVTTQVQTVNGIPVYVEGRGDLGRTPVFTQTDLMVAHEFKMGEVKRLRFEFNMTNLFNQKTSMFKFDRYNREEIYDSAGMDLSSVDLSQGFDWKSLVAASDAASVGKALDPRFGMDAMFNPGFQGRFLVKFIF